MLKLYEYEWLCYTEDSLGKCEYWVLRRKGVSPLFTKHKVKRRDVATAVSLFQSHPDGIKAMTLKEFYKLNYVEGAYWSPNEAIDHYAESVDNPVDK